jgi:hypothetical protein
MKKEDLVKIGLTEEQVEKVLEVNTEQLKGFIPKHRFDEVNTTKKDLESQIADRDKQLEELKKNNKDNEELQNTIKQLQESNKAAQEEYQANLSKIKLDNAIDIALNGAKAKNIKAVKALLDMDKVKLENETLSGLEEQLKALQEAEDSKFLFETKETKTSFSGVQPGEGNAGSSQGGQPKTLANAIMAKLTGNNE